MKPNWPLVLTCALFFLPTLSACGTSGSNAAILAGTGIPPLPSRLAQACTDPGVRDNKPALGELARTRQALAACRHLHRDTVSFYDGLRKGSAK